MNNALYEKYSMERITCGLLAMIALETKSFLRPVMAVRGSTVPYPRRARAARERGESDGRAAIPIPRREDTMIRATRNLLLFSFCDTLMRRWRNWSYIASVVIRRFLLATSFHLKRWSSHSFAPG